MKKTLAFFAAVLPLAAFAATQGPGPGAGAGGPPADADARLQQMQRRVRLVRDLGLAQALELSEQDALKLQANLAKLDDKRAPLIRQLRDNMQIVRRAAEGDSAAQKNLDQAIQRIFDARNQMHALDRDTYSTVAQNLPPEKRARALVFLAHFQQRMGHMAGRMMMHHGPGGRGMGPGMTPGMGPGMGPGMRGGGPGPSWGMNDAGPGSDDAMTMDCPEDCPMMND